MSVVNPVEKYLKIDIHHPAVSCFNVITSLLNRLVCITSRPEPVTGVREVRLKDRTQYLIQRLLDESAQHRGYPQLALSPPGLGISTFRIGWGR